MESLRIHPVAELIFVEYSVLVEVSVVREVLFIPLLLSLVVGFLLVLPSQHLEENNIQ